MIVHRAYVLGTVLGIADQLRVWGPSQPWNLMSRSKSSHRVLLLDPGPHSCVSDHWLSKPCFFCRFLLLDPSIEG